jgi:hypothetical protein
LSESDELYHSADYRTISKKIFNMNSFFKKIYTPYKILTPFQLLKPFFGSKNFEMNLRELSHSLLIIDEIHSYEPNIIGMTVATLQILTSEFKADVLLMFATTPNFLREMMQDELELENQIGLAPAELDLYSRHRIFVLKGNVFDYLDQILEDARSKRVLIVCNTVDSREVLVSFSFFSFNARTSPIETIKGHRIREDSRKLQELTILFSREEKYRYASKRESEGTCWVLLENGESHQHDEGMVSGDRSRSVRCTTC